MNIVNEENAIFMRGVNRVVLIGNLGKDPDIQYLEGNIPVAKFPLATTETYKDKTGKLISQTEWHNVVLWRGLAELAQKYLHKSSLVYIEGRLKTRYWEDRDHNKKVATEIIADNLIMLDKRSDGAQPGIEGGGGDIPGSEIPPIDEGSEKLPF
ncbi:MAG: single-stranded DNA-binding protein [Ginsengibacter sp.]